ncbi:MAG: hypothetical protein JWO90_1190 [Solirubrobacterales bacterium]|jgi:hypothetical protein|nr:hypothetical protein [Solirubrobacterales bacterium]
MDENTRQDKRDHQARVNVDDATWAEFRRYAPGSVSAVLGELVEREVQRYRRRAARDGSSDERRLPELIEDARQVHADFAVIIERMVAAKERPRPGVWRY